MFIVTTESQPLPRKTVCIHRGDGGGAPSPGAATAVQTITKFQSHRLLNSSKLPFFSTDNTALRKHGWPSVSAHFTTVRKGSAQLVS